LHDQIIAAENATLAVLAERDNLHTKLTEVEKKRDNLQTKLTEVEKKRDDLQTTLTEVENKRDEVEKDNSKLAAFITDSEKDSEKMNAYYTNLLEIGEIARNEAIRQKNELLNQIDSNVQTQPVIVIEKDIIHKLERTITEPKKSLDYSENRVSVLEKRILKLTDWLG